MLLGEAPELSLCVSVEAPFASELLAVVDEESPCEPDTISGVCDSIMAVCEVEVLASFAVGLPVAVDEASLPASGLPSVVGEASLPASFGIGLPAVSGGESLCITAGWSDVCDFIAAVARVGFSISRSVAWSVAAEYEPGDSWL